VLKYRIEMTPTDDGLFRGDFLTRLTLPARGKPASARNAMILAREDAQAALLHAAQWTIDPHRVGMVGFPAGRGSGGSSRGCRPTHCKAVARAGWASGVIHTCAGYDVPR